MAKAQSVDGRSPQKLVGKTAPYSRTAGAPEYGTSVPSAASAATWQFIARRKRKRRPSRICPCTAGAPEYGTLVPSAASAATWQFIARRRRKQRPTRIFSCTGGAPEYGISVPSAASAATWQFIARRRRKPAANPYFLLHRRCPGVRNFSSVRRFSGNLAIHCQEETKTGGISPLMSRC